MKIKTALMLATALCTLSTGFAVQAQQMPEAYQRVLATLARQGDYKDNVFKINIPRNDLSVSVDGVPTPTAFGFGGWLAMTKGEGSMDVMMGDLVLLEEEVNPVMSALLDQGLEVTALHNHFFYEQPRIFYMHVMGHGDPVALAAKVKPALDLIGHIPPRSKIPGIPAANPPSSARGSMDTDMITRIVGHNGEQMGPVYKITVGRPDLHIMDMGAAIGIRMGLNTWAAFTGNNQSAAMAGDVAMLGNEVQSVLKALRSHGIEVVAIHHHMIDTQPNIIFLHFLGKGSAEKLAAGFRAALDELGQQNSATEIRP